MNTAQWLALSAGLGLFAFVEPCSVGSHLLFLKVLDRLPVRERWWQTMVFAGVRALFMAALGVLAAWLGNRFLGVQHGLWAALGGLYVVLGTVYVGGGAGRLIRAGDRLLPRVSTQGAGATLGAVFALNIPACAAPLLALLLGGAAAHGPATTVKALPNSTGAPVSTAASRPTDTNRRAVEDRAPSAAGSPFLPGRPA